MSAVHDPSFLAALGAVVVGLGVLLLLPAGAFRLDQRVLGASLVGAVSAVVVLLQPRLVGDRLPLLVMAAFGVGAAYRQVRRGRLRGEASRRSASVLGACEGLAADLRAGQTPIAALQAAAREWPELQEVADAARLGSDVPAAMRRVAELPGARGLRTVAAAWVIAHRSGAGLADAVGLAARAVREDRTTARVVETEMASARATARLLAVLPMGVLLIGRGAGGDPFGFLTGSTAGLVCLGAGLSLTWAGLAWLEQIARSVQG